MKWIHKVQSDKTFLSSSIPSDWKSSQAHIVLRADKTYSLASAYSSINVLSIWQVHNRPAVYGCNQFWYRGPYPWTLWRGRHLIQHQRLLRKKERSEVANCWTLSNMKQEGIILCGWWRCFVASKLKEYTFCYFDLLFVLACCKEDTTHTFTVMWLWKEFQL